MDQSAPARSGSICGAVGLVREGLDVQDREESVDEVSLSTKRSHGDVRHLGRFQDGSNANVDVVGRHVRSLCVLKMPSARDTT